jgi:dimethylaniline monooxygenase (N-oxide forming) / hypotaurine monooxygenase
MPRAVNGVPVDHNLTARKVAVMDFLESRIPQLAEYLLNSLVRKLQDAAFNIRPEWHLSPPPPLKHASPIISDNLVDFLTTGAVLSVSGIRRVSGPGAIELDDGTCLEADVIIWCTGYKSDFGSLLEPSVDPSRHPPPQWEAAQGSRGKPLPRLYRNVFSLDHPRSLAFMGAVAYATGSFPLGDVASMALAQVWRGASPLPSAEEMEREADAQNDFVCGIAEEGGVVPGWVRQAGWFAWADEAAGARVGEHLGWGVEGWKFWLSDRRFCGMLMDGIYTPYVWRLFEGKRKRWEGARVEIEKLNTRAGRKKTD